MFDYERVASLTTAVRSLTPSPNVHVHTPAQAVRLSRRLTTNSATGQIKLRHNIVLCIVHAYDSVRYDLHVRLRDEKVHKYAT